MGCKARRALKVGKVTFGKAPGEKEKVTFGEAVTLGVKEMVRVAGIVKVAVLEKDVVKVKVFVALGSIVGMVEGIGGTSVGRAVGRAVELGKGPVLHDGGFFLHPSEQ